MIVCVNILQCHDCVCIIPCSEIITGGMVHHSRRSRPSSARPPASTVNTVYNREMHKVQLRESVACIMRDLHEAHWWWWVSDGGRRRW